MEEIFDNMITLLKKKRHDYGTSYEDIRKELGEIVPLIRLGDKMARLKQLIMKNDGVPMNESITDTYEDIIGYCVLELIYLGGM